MPASSISGLVSTAAYIAATLLLMAVLLGPSMTLYQDVSQRGASTLAAGIATQLDALSPGMSSGLEFSSYPGMSVMVHISASVLTATVDGRSSSQTLLWRVLVPVTLSSDAHYTITLGSGGVLALA